MYLHYSCKENKNKLVHQDGRTEPQLFLFLNGEATITNTDFPSARFIITGNSRHEILEYLIATILSRTVLDCEYRLRLLVST
jgi:hypothetical protein